MWKILWAALAALNLVVAVVLQTLPAETVATHFDINGQPNGYMELKVLSFFIFFVVIVGNIPLLISYHFAKSDRNLKWFNIPKRAYWLESHERMQIAVRKIQTLLQWTGVFVNGVLLAANGLIYVYNNQMASGTLVNVFVAVVFLVTALFLIATFRLFRPMT